MTMRYMLQILMKWSFLLLKLFDALTLTDYIFSLKFGVKDKMQKFSGHKYYEVTFYFRQ